MSHLIDTFMESALHDLLKNLCDKYGWSYGAFWSYDEENPLLLTLKNVYLVDEVRAFADDMFRKVYVVGDGLVGQVAFSGIHSWVSSDTLEEDPFRLFGCQDTFQTVAVVPLEPRGVAQFGSFAKITESVEFLDEAKRLFGEIETVDETESMDLLLDQLLSPTWNHQPALYESQSPLVDACLQSSQSDQLCFSPMMPSAQTSIQYNVELEPNTDIEPQQSYSIDSLGSDDLEILANLLEDQEEISLDHVLENCRSFSDQEEISLDHVLGNCRSFSDNSTDLDHNHHLGYKTSTDTFRESHDFLNQQFRHGQLIEPRAVNYGLESNSLPCVEDCSIFQHPVTSQWQDLYRFGQVSASGNCVGNFTPAQESLMSISRNMPDYSTLLFDGIPSQRLKYNADRPALGRSWTTQANTITNSTLNYKPMGASKEGMTKVAKVVKKKAKPGEARHRPKDRELQQKFYAQLRSLVPDGQKCTQDGLLKRTIRHIGFLQSVSKYRDTLKHGYHPKVSLESAETLDNQVTVEVLPPTGSYVTEMIWNGRLPFFETLDRLRGHGLNVLNGAMEARENKTWAYFIVETVRNSSKEDIHQLMRQILGELGSNGTQPYQQLDSSQGQSELNSTNVHFPHNVLYDRLTKMIKF